MVRNQIEERRTRACALVMLIALLSACSDAPPTTEVKEEVFGATLPSDAELATYPKILPAEAFAAGGARGAAAPTVAPTPTSFVIPASALPPVQAQGTSTNFGYPGSCEVWSAGYAMGSYAANLTNQQDIKDLANTVSTAYVYMTVLANIPGSSCGGSTKASETLEYLVANTAPSLASIPYYPVCECPSGSDQCLDDVMLDQSCETNPEFCTQLSIGSWSAFEKKKPIDQILTMIQTWLSTSRIVQISIVVPYDFKDYTSGVYDAPTACPSPQPSNCAQYGAIACIASTKDPSGCAQHGIAIVGYDDSQGALLIQNSFGTGWGEQGYMWMSYSTFKSIYLGGTIAFAPKASSATSSAVATTSAAVDAGFQWVDHRDAGAPKTDLIFASTLDQPIALGTITITTPDGRTLSHEYGHWFGKGYHYVTRHDGNQFPSGTYTVRLQGTTRSGEVVSVESTAEVALAAGETLPAAPIGNDITGTNGQPAQTN